MVFKAVLFDLDGTLLDTIDDIAEAINFILGELGFPPHSVEDYKRYVGAGVDHLMRKALPEDSQDEATIKKFLKLESLARSPCHTRPYDGITELLTELSARGIRMAVLSNRPERSTRALVQGMLGRWHFEAVMGAGERLPLKPDPKAALEIARRLSIDPAEFLYLGDSDIDMMTAANAGMYPVGCAWGFRPASELRQNGAKALITKPMELFEICPEL